MRSVVRVVIVLCCLVGGVGLPAAAGQSQAAPPTQTPSAGWFSSEQQVVAPLQPVNVQVSAAGYSGPAMLLVFDGAGRAAGSWQFTIPPAGTTTIQVLPRGSLGNHWAALFAGDNKTAEGVLYRLEAETTVQTGVLPYDDLYPRVRGFMNNCVLEYWLNDRLVHGYRSPDSPLLWLRDHYYQGRGFKYFDANVTNLIDAFREAQNPDGSFPDFLARPEYGIPAYRTPVEADVEYLFVLAVYEAWQMTGDDAWLVSNVEAMQRAIHYTLTNPLRWEPSVGLVKRPYTIDTWDFEYGPATIDPNSGKIAPRHWIDDRTIWGIFHGDNTGVVRALRALATIENYVGQPDNASQHRSMADAILSHLDNLSWNGSFYTHHVKLGPWAGVPGVDESSQLSLSNAYALNRGVLTPEQGRAILNEYRNRLTRAGNVSFVEWWSIDPPFPSGSFGMGGRLGEDPGYYVNGGVMPLVGGELSRGAFRYGYEAYGFDILQRYHSLIRSTNASYLWYHPTGGEATGHNVLPTDGWGASAMLAGLMEGAAGVEDNGVKLSNVTISPRWPASVNEDKGYAPVYDAYVVVRYAASDAYVAYRWQHMEQAKRLRMEVTGSGEVARLRLLLPPQATGVSWVTFNGERAPTMLERVGTSRYVLLDNVPQGIIQVEMKLQY
jgi:hypothetical protein